MLIHYIRDANRNPVACVVSTDKGKVGWSVYHPDDHEEVPRVDTVFRDGTLVHIPVTGATTKRRVSFSKEQARKIAAERSADVRVALRDMDESVPESRTFTKNVKTKAFLSDEHGFKIGPTMWMPEVRESNLKDELAFWIEHMNDLSLEYDPVRAKAKQVETLLDKLKSLGWKP